MHPNKANFVEGLGLIFGRWVAMQMALQMEWAGPMTGEKVATFIEGLVDYFDREGRSIEEEDIEDILVTTMQDEFSTLLEDSSEVEVARAILTLFRESVQGRTKLLDVLRRRATAPLPAAEQHGRATEGSDGESGDEDGESGDEDGESGDEDGKEDV